MKRVKSEGEQQIKTEENFKISFEVSSNHEEIEGSKIEDNITRAF
jgi:hypothetical protein